MKRPKGLRGLIIAAFAVLFVVTMGMGILNIQAIGRMGAAGQRVGDELASVDLLGRMLALSQQLRSNNLMAHYATGPSERRATFLAQLEKTHRAFFQPGRTTRPPSRRRPSARGRRPCARRGSIFWPTRRRSRRPMPRMNARSPTGSS